MKWFLFGYLLGESRHENDTSVSWCRVWVLVFILTFIGFTWLEDTWARLAF